jgi:hypothetical protein
MPPVPSPGSMTWIALAALIVGAFVRALKADAIPALLTKFLRPDGPPIAIPTRVLPWLALVGGGGLAFLEALREGSSYADAGQAAVLAAAGSVFGHELLSGVPGTKKLLGGLLLLVGLGTAPAACTPANTPREQARSVVLTVAEGVRIGDETCAWISKAKKDLSLAETCAAAVLEARNALLIAEGGVDAWDAAAAEKLPCATKAAASALSRVLGAIERAGGKIPPAVADALQLAPLLAGACRG